MCKEHSISKIKIFVHIPFFVNPKRTKVRELGEQRVKDVQRAFNIKNQDICAYSVLCEPEAYKGT